MNDQTTSSTVVDDDEERTNKPIGASIKIDYAEIAAATEPDQPGGRIVYSSDDYETDEEADAALEEFFNRIIEGADLADQAQAPTISQPPDPEYPHIPYPIIRPVVGSPYYIDPLTGWEASLFPPGTPPLTSEDVRREMEDFP